MTAISHALDRVQFRVFSGHSYGLAIHKAAEETGTPQREITDALAARRASRRAAAKARETIKPHWTDGY